MVFDRVKQRAKTNPFNLLDGRDMAAHSGKSERAPYTGPVIVLKKPEADATAAAAAATAAEPQGWQGFVDFTQNHSHQQWDLQTRLLAKRVSRSPRAECPRPCLDKLTRVVTDVAFGGV